MDKTTPPKYYLIEGMPRNRLIMTRGLTTRQARVEMDKYFLDLIMIIDSRQMKRIKATEVSKEFSAGVALMKCQSFIICLFCKNTKRNEIEMLWVTTSREKKRVIFIAK